MAKRYNWELPDWPNFHYQSEKLEGYERDFLQKNGIILGIEKGIQVGDKEELKIKFLSEEAYKTSEIEGEILDRDSIQSSIRRHFGLHVPKLRNRPKEFGIAEMMVSVYNSYEAPLRHDTLFDWHRMLMNGRRDIDQIGAYRSHVEPMQIVSGRLDRRMVYFEAPPSNLVPEEMENFINWFNQSKGEIPSLIRAGMGHLYFETIHPFEDGNGRIGRALMEKSMAQDLGRPTFILFSKAIQAKRKVYYDALHQASLSNEITNWLLYSSQLILEAVELTTRELELLLKKVRVFLEFSFQLNPRQEKVLRKLFEAGAEGFQGGLSAKNYVAIAKTSPATATRDLTELVEWGILEKSGRFKSTRYELA